MARRKSPGPDRQDPLDLLSSGVPKILDRPLARRERDQFGKYLNLLIKWQRAHRLVGSIDPAWIVQNLFLDSLLFLQALPQAFSSLLDIGSGAGVPGIPLKIVRPEVGLTLIESRQRRASFLAAAVRELGLAATRVVNARAEAVVSELAGQFDAVVFRCAGPLDELLPLAGRFLASGGVVVAAGGPTVSPPQSADRIDVINPLSGGHRALIVARNR